jgi:spermidine synthase
MDKNTRNSLQPPCPLLYEEDDTLSLHFGFPTIQSSMLRADPERLILDYTRTMMGFLLFNPRPQRIAMIGLGGGSLAKYCCRNLPESDFTAIELSPEVIALRSDFGIPDDNPNFRIVCADGADYVDGANDAFDVLLVDGFDQLGQPRQLCSTAFYDACRSALRDEGLLVVNLCADDTGYGSYVGRISTAFDTNIVVVEADEGENKIVFARKGRRIEPSLSELTERLRQLETRHPVDLDKTAQKILSRNQTRRRRQGGRR